MGTGDLNTKGVVSSSEDFRCNTKFAEKFNQLLAKGNYGDNMILLHELRKRCFSRLIHFL